MSDNSYTPPKVWTWDTESGGRFSSINRPIAGATHDKELPVGKHPYQLYSQGTPNGVKVTILLEELLALGEDAEYDAWMINIGSGDQFGSGFVGVNPNSKIPAMMDHTTDPPTRIFESGAILLYLAEKFGRFVPMQGTPGRAECLSWLFWLQGSAPYLGGGFGHFYAYAPEKWRYPIDRYAMEVKRQLDVLERNLADREYLCGDDYNISDIAVFSWYGTVVLNNAYNAAEFLEVHTYEQVNRWANQIRSRNAVWRGRKVNRAAENGGVPERHSAADIDAVLSQAKS